ncbi:MAG: flagellar basal body-associated FliL family protein [Alistipes sp.]|nr:flagellar basal body-associated FliL family protein [Alistipes sp.]
MKKNTLSIIILTMTVINLVLNVLIIFSVLPMANKTNSLITKIAEVVNLEVTPMLAAEGTVLKVEDIDSRTIMTPDGTSTKHTISIPGADGKNHYVVTSVIVSLDMTNEDYKKLSEGFDNATALISSKVDSVISSYTYETVLASKEQIQDQLLEEVRSLFQSNMIYDVSLQGFTVQ